MNKILNQLANAGVSIWLDDLSRDRINSGNLTELITEKNVVGVTTNPAIFAAALASGEAYLSQLKDIAATNPDPEHCVFELTTSDVSSACDLFLPKFHQSKGRDGRVSIEVSPQLADDEAATVAAAIELWKKIDKPNVLIKIPATDAGCTAITKVIGAGISVNVTLIFGLARYQQVIDAYLSGLELAKENGHDLSQIHSVASFFVSRVDTEIDNRLVELNRPDLSGKAAVANARLAYQLYQHNLAETRWQQLAAKGANPQRPLWASTGVKNPDYSDTMYVDDLVVCDTVNTMPEKTLLAVADHGDLRKYQDQVTGNYQIAQAHLAALAAVGISYNSVISTLEAEGIEKFKIAWDELLTTVAGQIQAN